jgi:hypothetical protein
MTLPMAELARELPGSERWGAVLAAPADLTNESTDESTDEPEVPDGA